VLPAPPPLVAEASPAALLSAVNFQRLIAGARPLKADALLARAARSHSRDMVARHYFSHTSPGGSSLRTRVQRTGWTRFRPSWALAENLAWGTGPLATPSAIVDAWMHSPPHRANLLRKDLRLAGIGVVGGTPNAGPDGVTVTLDLGSR
jgi:uncharacterized protein YkwD